MICFSLPPDYEFLQGYDLIFPVDSVLGTLEKLKCLLNELINKHI